MPSGKFRPPLPALFFPAVVDADPDDAAPDPFPPPVAARLGVPSFSDDDRLDDEADEEADADAAAAAAIDGSMSLLICLATARVPARIRFPVGVRSGSICASRALIY